MEFVKKVEEHLGECGNYLSTVFIGWACCHMKEWAELGREIQSPMEQLFYVEWLCYKFHHDSRISEFHLEPQYSDSSTDGFIVDFYVDLIDEVLGWKEMSPKFKAGKAIEIITSVKYPKIAIEIDGHMFHEKTKEQVTRDKKRERKLISNDWKIVRFSGSEVYNQCSKCVDEMIGLVLKIRQEYHKILYEKLGKL